MDMDKMTGIPTCECGGIIKPDVVLYVEGLDNTIINKSLKSISETDMLIIGEVLGAV